MIRRTPTVPFPVSGYNRPDERIGGDMAGGGRPVAAGIALVAALALGIAWLSWGGTGSGPRRPTARAEHEFDAGWAADAAAAPQPRAAGAAAAPAVERSPAQEAALAAVPTAAPGDAFDTPEWQSARVAFRPRELGRLGPYVQAGLDSARRDMEFCFRSARTPAERIPAPAADPPGEEEPPPPPPRADPGILLLFVEAREGALDVIGTRLEHRGTSSPEVVECCREVLRGFEIKAFNTVPGRRYRLKFRLQ